MHSHCSIKTKNTLQNVIPQNLYANKRFQPINFFQTLLALCAINVSMVKTISSERPFIKVNMQGVSGSWLFNTGASVTLISIKEFRKISSENRPQKKPATINLTCASDKMLSIVGIYDLDLTIQGRTVRHPVYVANNLGNAAILGIDAIKAFGLIYSPTKNNFNFENKIKLSK